MRALLLLLLATKSFASTYEIGEYARVRLDHYDVMFCNTDVVKVIGICEDHDPTLYELTPIFCIVNNVVTEMNLVARDIDLIRWRVL